MKATFFGVRGSIPLPGPSTVRYGGNTACVLVRLADGGLIVLDCGTGARELGLSLTANELQSSSAGREITFLLSHSHWDHIQGFPFFRPFYGPKNRFTIYGGAASPSHLEALLEGQMAAEYFPLQTFRNMGAHIEIRAIPAQRTFRVGAAVVEAHANPHGANTSYAYRIEDQGRVLVYAADVGYPESGPSAEALALYHDADLLIHDATFLPEHQQPRTTRGLSSIDDAVAAALGARARRLALFHYGEPYDDHDIDGLVARARERAGTGLQVIGAAEGATLEV